jgi:hypothetical protein
VLACACVSCCSFRHQVWDAEIKVEDIGVLGDCEAHRERLGRGRTMGAHELWWMTDRTPHESLPLPAGTYRQLRAAILLDLYFWFVIFVYLPLVQVMTLCVSSPEHYCTFRACRYFRLVTNSVSAWYSRHSTPNPLGIQPDCPILDIDKFEEGQRMLASEASGAAKR